MYHAPPPRTISAVETRPASDCVTVVDIGARGGLHPCWVDCSIVVQGVGFDADAEECARLNARGDGVRYLPYALGSRDGAKATLYITDSPGSSSLLEPNREVLDQFLYGSRISVTTTTPVTLTTLDTACERHEIAPDVIKLDIQGAELDVLRGAVRTLANALLIESEVEFQPLYVGQPLFRDIDAFMAKKGWVPWRRIDRPTTRRSSRPGSAGRTWCATSCARHRGASASSAQCCLASAHTARGARGSTAAAAPTPPTGTTPTSSDYGVRRSARGLPSGCEIAFSSASVHGRSRPSAEPRTSRTSATSTGDAVWPNDRRTKVSTAATSASDRVPSGGIIVLPSLPWITMRAMMPARPVTNGDPASAGASPSRPRPSG